MTRFEALGILPDKMIYGYSLSPQTDSLECTEAFTPEALVDHLPTHAVFRLREMVFRQWPEDPIAAGLFVHVSFVTNKGIVGTYLQPDGSKLCKLI